MLCQKAHSKPCIVDGRVGGWIGIFKGNTKNGALTTGMSM